MRLSLIPALSISLLATAACDDSHTCLPGREIACSCSDGSKGSQMCQEDHTFGNCFCDEWSTSSNTGASSGRDGSTTGPDASTHTPDAARADSSVPHADGGPDAAMPAPAGGEILTSGSAVLVDVFAQDQDVWVVDSEGATHLRLRDGAELGRFSAARPVTAAAFDGEHLVIADGAKLTTLTASTLAHVADGNLVEACAGAVLLSGKRMVCGPAKDTGRVFYTYDALTGRFLASSAMYTYHGIPMRRVPGMDAFVTVSVGISPSDFHLYTLGADSAAVYVNESPYHGDFAANMVFAFDSATPEHLITSEGLLLRFSTSCGAGSSFDSQCFVKDGALGTITGAQTFIALDNESTTLVGLVDPRGTTYYDPTVDAGAGLILQSIDVPSRTIEAQRVLSLSLGRVVAFRALTAQGLAVLGTANDSGFAYEPTTAGYQVVRLALTE